MLIITPFVLIKCNIFLKKSLFIRDLIITSSLHLVIFKNFQEKQIELRIIAEVYV